MSEDALGDARQIPSTRLELRGQGRAPALRLVRLPVEQIDPLAIHFAKGKIHFDRLSGIELSRGRVPAGYRRTLRPCQNRGDGTPGDRRINCALHW